MRYQVPYDQGENLPNKLGIANPSELALAEFEGFLRSELILTSELTSFTKFDLLYLKRIHVLALGKLYDFAGKWRVVNLSKGGFFFAPSHFLHQNMEKFEQHFLAKCNVKYRSRNKLIKDSAKIHAELLLIHPFREGNGRTARVLTNLIFRRSGFEPPDWSKLDSEKFDRYISGVQQAVFMQYDVMTNLFIELS